jgi:hypothetical protein
MALAQASFGAGGLGAGAMPLMQGLPSALARPSIKQTLQESMGTPIVFQEIATDTYAKVMRKRSSVCALMLEEKVAVAVARTEDEVRTHGHILEPICTHTCTHIYTHIYTHRHRQRARPTLTQCGTRKAVYAHTICSTWPSTRNL